MEPGARRRWTLVGLAVAYFVIAQASLRLASAGSFSFFWPASGVALAAMILLGYGVWPAVAVGAGASALLAGTPPAALPGEVLANVFEALIGTWLFRRLGLDPTLDRIRDVALFAGPVTVLAALAGALVGPAAFWWGGAAPSTDFLTFFGLWALGDGLGILVVTPTILAVRDGRLAGLLGRPHEALALLAVLAGALLLLYAPIPGTAAPGQPVAFVVLPVLLWAAVRFGMAGATLALLLSGIAGAVGTVHGQGPFADYERLVPRLVAAQAYLAVDALCALLVAAAGAERTAAIRRREEVLSAVSRELKAPLAPLRRSARRCRKRVAAGHLPSPGTLARLEARVDRLSRLVDGLLLSGGSRPPERGGSRDRAPRQARAGPRPP